MIISIANIKYRLKRNGSHSVAHIQVVSLISFPHLTNHILGALSAWFRLKYPDLVYGAISSSGPVTALIDFRGSFSLIIFNKKIAILLHVIRIFSCR